jgi:hypothetical protein
MKRIITSLAALAILASAANAQVWINEVLTNPNGSDSTATTGNEHFELRGTPNLSLSGYYLLSIEGGGTTGRGDINQFFDLGSFSIGANGYLFARQNFSLYTATAPGATVIQPSTGQGWLGLSGYSADSSQTDLENGTTTIMLINRNSGAAPTLTLDLDSDNDGILDSVPAGWSIVDSVGIIEGSATGGATDWSYGAVTLRVQGTAAGSSQYGNIVDIAGAPPTTAGAMWVGRKVESTGSSANDWIGAILTGSASDPLNITFASSNDPDIVGKKLPDMVFGGTNIPEPGTLALLGLGSLALLLRRKTR